MTPLFAALAEMGRIRLALFVLAVLLFALTFESIRRTQLKERYALLWVIPSFAILFLAFFPGVLDFVRRFFGMEYGSIMAGVAFLALMFAVFAICRTLSKSPGDAIANPASSTSTPSASS